MVLFGLLVFGVVLLAAIFWAGLVQRHVHIWFIPYIKHQWRMRSVKVTADSPVHILFCFADHYEPYCAKATHEKAMARVRRWTEEYPAFADKFRDADGRPPQHSFFYPEEEYNEAALDEISALCKQGYGEIEVHLHHDQDTEQGLRNKLESFTKILHTRHDALSQINGRPVYAFIHGNWALDNSCADGKWCGVNNELIVLRETGCYADFTLPSAPSEAQTRTVNSIYYAKDDPLQPKSHDQGQPMHVGGKPWGDLLMIQGPLGLNWKRRKFGIWPRVESGDMPDDTIPISQRVAGWVNARVHVEGRPEWLFVKVYTHGCVDRFLVHLLGSAMDELHRELQSQFNDGKNHQLHYVTAREMFNIAKAAESGKSGNPNQYRDFVLPRPKNRSFTA